MKKLMTALLAVFALISCVPKKEYTQEKLRSHKEIAKIYIADGRYQDALRELTLAISTDKCDAETYNLLGVVYLNLKDYAKAEESFNEALKLAPNFSEAYNNLGLLNLLQGRYQQAISYFEKALANPLYANAHSAKTNMAQAYYLLGDKNKAIEILISLLKERADYAQALIELGKIYLNEMDLQAAEFYFKQALKLDRTSSEARYYLGEVFFQQGKFDLAKELWESLIQIRPDSPWSSLAREKVFFLERLKTQKP
jgi:type IV pilus assembly protein PilF